MKVMEVKEYSKELHLAINGLLPQLSRSTPTVSKEHLERVISSDSNTLFIAIDNGHYCGSLTLIVLDVLTGMRGWIDDVVVSEAARGKGIGKLLLRTALDHAQKNGVKKVDLTSRPERKEANALYKSLGFELRETNAYRYEMP